MALATGAYYAAYDAVLRQWPVAVEAIDVPSGYGTTRVNVCGPQDGTPLVLLHGGGATSTVWFANVADLARTHRVYAVDQMGGPGRSVHDGQPISTLADLMGWLEGLFVHLGLDRAQLCGHSYGAWLALSYALHSPHRVDKLVLLDPTVCFARMGLSYLLHAAPLLARPTAGRVEALIRWETSGAPVDPAWLRLMAGAVDFTGSKVVLPRRPEATRLQASTLPTLLLLAERSRAHDIRRVLANAHSLMPHVATTILPGVSHHSVPTENAARLNGELLRFLG